MVERSGAARPPVSTVLLCDESGSMFRGKKSIKVLILVLTIGGIQILHYSTWSGMVYQHALYRMLFYFPLVLGALWFGLKGALWVCGSVSVLNLPYAFAEWQALSLEAFHQILEGVLYIVIALILGLLVERERKQHRALVQAESLAAVGRAVSEVAHDMKTPLVAIGGFAHRYHRRMTEDDPNREDLKIVVQETARLQSMVEHMLEYGSPRRLQPTTSRVNDLVRECLKIAQPLAQRNGVALSKDLDPSNPSIFVDVHRLKRVILNLITNAIQASPSGQIVMVKTQRSARKVELKVIDGGCGIQEEDRDKLFTPFFSSRKEGTGLGLAIVKKTVEAHGGEVFCHSNPEKGVTFSIRLPQSEENGRHGSL
jgi:two-component system sensor histidine kinase HydH